MSKPFDVTTKELIRAHAKDWAVLARMFTQGRVELLDADLSTVSTAADKLLHLIGPPELILHLELQASPDGTFLLRCVKYNILTRDKTGLPVHTVIILLRPSANSPSYTGTYTCELPDGRTNLEFHYDVIRVWELPVEDILASGLGVLPLAPISRVQEPELPGVIQRMRARIESEAPPDEAARLLTSSFILTGLSHSKDAARELFKGIDIMRESSTYQMIYDEGAQDGLQKGVRKGSSSTARSIILRLGGRSLGIADESTRAALEKIEDVYTLETLAEKVQDVKTWQELLSLANGTNGHNQQI